ncbi:MAG: PhzF family phenazine biosynthesis protein [Acidobacteriota bacterium]
MPEYRYLHYDVFTDRPLEGNQLAVFTDARGLDAAAMQAITREMNFSESTFLLPSERPDTDIRMRIFTPGVEMPMAGHPTVGTTFALAHDGVIAPGRERWVFGLNIGPTPVELAWTDDGRLQSATMDQRPPEFRRPASPRGDIIAALGVDRAAVADDAVIEEVSCGVPFVYVPVTTRAALDAAEPDMAACRRLRSAFPGRDHVALFAFSLERVEPDVTAYSRMFAPDLGVGEDPATGAASGPLGCYLVHHGLVDRARGGHIVSLQGVAMKRPSRIHIAITQGDDGAITRVQVGGHAVLVGEGVLRI